MAWTVVPNYAATSAAQATYKLIDMLVDEGWTIQASGDGLSAYSTNPNAPAVTHGGSGANGLNNLDAWVRLRAPGGTPVREVLLRRGNDGSGGSRAWQVRYSSNGTGFVTGGSATVIPTAADQTAVLDAPGEVAIWQAGGYAAYDLIVGDATEEYSWAMICRRFNLQERNREHISLLAMDVLTDPHAADTDPCVMHVVPVENHALGSGSAWFRDDNNPDPADQPGAAGWFRKGSAAFAKWVFFSPMFQGNNNSTARTPYGNYHGRQLWDSDNRVVTMPMVIGRGAAGNLARPASHKGVSRIFRLNTEVPSTGLLNTDRSRAFFGMTNYPWDGTSKLEG